MLCLLGTNVSAENKPGTGPRRKGARANHPACPRNGQNAWGARAGERSLEGAARGSLQDRTHRAGHGPSSPHVARLPRCENPAGEGLGDPDPVPMEETS